MVTESSKKIDNIKINLKNVDNTKTAAEIYITYSFNNLNQKTKDNIICHHQLMKNYNLDYMLIKKLRLSLMWKY